MRRIGWIIGAVLVLIGTYYADKLTWVRTKARTSAAKSDSPGSQNQKSGGEPEPKLTLKDLNGNDVSLSDYKGKVVLVNFWATWCEACRAEIPWLIEMQKKYADKGFVILGIALDDEGQRVVAPFVAKERFDVNGHEEPMDYKILIGNDDAADKFGGLFGYPTSILISKDGKQIKRITGVISPDEMTKTIQAQL